MSTAARLTMIEKQVPRMMSVTTDSGLMENFQFGVILLLGTAKYDEYALEQRALGI